MWIINASPPRELTRYYPGKGGQIVVLLARPLTYEAAEKCLSAQSQKACFWHFLRWLLYQRGRSFRKSELQFYRRGRSLMFSRLTDLPARPLILKIRNAGLPAFIILLYYYIIILL